MSTHKKGARRIVASIGIAAVGVLGVAVGASAAGAPGQPDGREDGTLTIHKYVGVDGEWTGNGSEAEITGKTPLEGVTFTAYPIEDIDLTNQADWNAVAGLTGTCDPANVTGHTLGQGVTVGPTNAAGFASATLGVAAYLVCETDAPANVTEESAPFIVTIPMPNGEDGWRYDVHAYPKNQLLEGEDEKAVDDEDAIVEGDEVSFTVSSKFQNAPVSSFVMTDQIDPRLAYIPDSLTVTAVIPAPNAGTENVTDSFTVTSVDGLLTATATPDGLGVLNALPAGYKLDFEFKVTVLDGSVGTIANTANVNGVETNTVETKWGNIEITKVDKETRAKLKGAEFEIYEGACPAAEGAESLYTLTTPASGVVTSGSLKEGTYCVVETKAPAGYVDPTWSQTVEVTAGESSTSEVEVENAQQEVPTLPNTGSSGVILMSVAGVSLVALGGVLAVVSRRRKVTA